MNCFRCNNKRSAFNQAIYDGLHKKKDYGAAVLEIADDDADDTIEDGADDQIVDVREMDDDDGPPTFYQRYLLKYWVRLKPYLSCGVRRNAKRFRGFVGEKLPKLHKRDQKKLDEAKRKFWKALGMQKRPRRKVAPERSSRASLGDRSDRGSVGDRRGSRATLGSMGDLPGTGAPRRPSLQERRRSSLRLSRASRGSNDELKTGE